MKNIMLTILVVMSLAFCGGCDILEAMLGNVGGYDLSACGDSPSVCIELVFDNIDKIEYDIGDIFGF